MGFDHLLSVIALTQWKGRTITPPLSVPFYTLLFLLRLGLKEMKVSITVGKCTAYFLDLYSQ